MTLLHEAGDNLRARRIQEEEWRRQREEEERLRPQREAQAKRDEQERVKLHEELRAKTERLLEEYGHVPDADRWKGMKGKLRKISNGGYAPGKQVTTTLVDNEGEPISVTIGASGYEPNLKKSSIDISVQGVFTLILNPNEIKTFYFSDTNQSPKIEDLRKYREVVDLVDNQLTFHPPIPQGRRSK